MLNVDGEASTIDETFKALETDPDMRYLFGKLKMWQNIMHDKCFRNELTDVLVVNPPKVIRTAQKIVTSAEQKKEQSHCKKYVFAAFLAPGIHEVKLHCPVKRKSYSKRIAVDLNKQDFYPEYPH